MNHQLRSLAFHYGMAIGSVGLATVLRFLAQPYLGSNSPFITFYPAVFATVVFTRLKPTLLAVVLSALAASWWFIPPQYSVLPGSMRGWLSFGIFIFFGIGVALLGEAKHRQSDQIQRERRRFFVTLASIGDGVIVTDEKARVTFLNAIAEEFTGWTLAEAIGQPLDAVFRIVDEQTRAPSKNPVMKALREGRVVGLTNHTLLIDKEGTERAIDDSAAPIREANGTIVGVVLVFRDVSEQRAAQIERARLAAIVGSSEDAIIGQSFDGLVTNWNAGAERLFGYQAEEILGKSMFSTIVPADRKAELEQVFEQIRQGKRVGQFESVRQRRDGGRIPVAIRISPIQNADGEIIGASAIDRDISLQKAAERRRNARLAVTQILAHEQSIEKAVREILAAVCSALDWDIGCFWRFDPVENQLLCQEYWQESSRDLDAFRQATLEMSLSPGNSLPGRVWETRQPIWVTDVATDSTFVRAKVAQEVGLHGGFSCPVGAGAEQLGVVEWFSQQFQQPDEDLLEMMATIGGQIGQFIERKMSEKALEESEQLYRAIGESIDYGVWVCDAEGRNIYASDSFLKLVGMTQAECSQAGWTQVLHPEDVEETYTAWKECVRTLGTWDREHRCLGVDGKYHPILARGVPVRDEKGHVIWWAGINLDIARLKEVEDALREADRRKDEFLAMLAHELRNPLAPIRSGLDILAMDNTSHQDIVHLMQEQLEHVIRLVDDLLDVSRIMRGRIELRKEPVQLSTLIHRSVKAVRPLIDSHQQELVVSLAEEPIWLNADPVRVVQILENLLNNASKYTDADGRIEITAKSEGNEAVVSVRDTGIGIEPELLPNVFELFTQSSRSLDRAQGGLGIGLTLVQRLVEMHEGSVSVDSEGPGHGSMFAVRLPMVQSVKQTPLNAETPQMPPGRRILVVDDNVGAARVLAKLLTQIGDHEVETAHDGVSAFEKVKASHPEIVLLDIGLPGMDGYQVGKRIRELPEFDGVLLVALTGYGQSEDRQKSKEIGFDEHLVKPPSIEQMKEVLSHPKLAM